MKLLWLALLVPALIQAQQFSASASLDRIVEEAVKTGAFGAQIAAWLAEELFDELDAPILRVASKDVPIPFSPPMEEFVIPNAGDVVAAIRRLC